MTQRPDAHVEQGLDDFSGALPWLSPISDGVWLDPDGTRWRLRGQKDALPVKRVEHLLRSDDARVLLFYGTDGPTEVSPVDRAALWQRIQPHLRGRISGDFTSFRTAEFRDDERRPLLVIEESC